MSELHILPGHDGQPDAAEDAPAERLCRACWTVRPLAEFRLRRRGGTVRYHQCRRCHSQWNRDWQRERRNKVQRREMGKALTTLATQPDQEAMALAFRAMMHTFGGWEGVIARWVDTYQHARRGSFSSFRCLRPILQMIIDGDDNSRAPVSSQDYDQMSDADFAENLVRVAKNAIADQPEIAVLAAQRLGWTVIPPGGVEEDDSAG